MNEHLDSTFLNTIGGCSLPRYTVNPSYILTDAVASMPLYIGQFGHRATNGKDKRLAVQQEVRILREERIEQPTSRNGLRA